MFRQILTQDVAYNSLLVSQRKGLHKRAGEVIETLFPTLLDDLAGALAQHFEKAEVHDKALLYLVKAGHRARQAFANQEAIDYYLRALKIAVESAMEPAEISPIHEGLADVHALMAKYALASDHYEKALGPLTDHHHRAVLLRKMGHVYEKSGRYEQAIERYTKGLEEMHEQLDSTEVARIQTGLGLVYYRLNRLEEAIDVSSFALEIMQNQGDKWGLAEAYNNLGIIHSTRGDAEKALEFHRHSLSVWMDIKESCGLAASHNNLGYAYAQMADWKKAIEHYKESLTLCEAMGNRHGLARIFDNLGKAYAKLGQPDQAWACIEKATTIMTEISADSSELVPEMWQQSGAW